MTSPERFGPTYITARQDGSSPAFGAEIVDYARDEETQHIAWVLAFKLSTETQTLIDSDHPHDQTLVKNIDSKFQAEDLEASRKGLQGKLSNPLSAELTQWLARASPEDIKAYCGFHTERQQHFQYRLDEELPELQEITLGKVDRLIDCGLFPKVSKDLFRAAMRHYGSLRPIDFFDLASHERMGYCDDDEIGVANLFVRKEDFYGHTRTLKNVVFHEYLHGAGRDKGFFKGISTPHRLRIIEEAFVEHATSVADSTYEPGTELDHRQPEIINPYNRHDISNSYIAERAFLSILISHGETVLPADFMAETYFSQPDSRFGQRRRAELERRLTGGIGSKQDFFTIVDFYESLKTADGRNEYLKTVNKMITTKSGTRLIFEEEIMQPLSLPYKLT